MSKKTIEIADRFTHSETAVLQLASKIIPQDVVAAIMTNLRMTLRREIMIFEKGRVPRENIYLYTDCFAEKAEELFLQKKEEIFSSITAESFSRIATVARELKTTSEEIQYAVKKMFGPVPNFLIREQNDTLYLHNHVVECITPLFKKRKSVQLVYVGQAGEQALKRGHVAPIPLHDESFDYAGAFNQIFA